MFSKSKSLDQPGNRALTLSALCTGCYNLHVSSPAGWQGLADSLMLMSEGPLFDPPIMSLWAAPPCYESLSTASGVPGTKKDCFSAASISMYCHFAQKRIYLEQVEKRFQISQGRFPCPEMLISPLRRFWQNPLCNFFCIYTENNDFSNRSII